MARAKTFVDITGMTFEKWKVIEYSGYLKGQTYWLCKCQCGTIKNIRSSKLRNGESKSCGCLKQYRKLSDNKTSNKNEYFVVGDTAIIKLNYRNLILDCIIDKEDIERVCLYYWTAKYSRAMDSYYVGSRFGDKKCLLIHRIITDCPSNLFVDHKNHNTLDNRKSNLRISTNSLNQQNQKGLKKNNKSGIRGVHWNKRGKTWEARVKVNQKIVFNKCFKDIHEAETAVKKARARLMPFSKEAEELKVIRTFYLLII
jgi:hypothetical protein